MLTRLPRLTWTPGRAKIMQPCTLWLTSLSKDALSQEEFTEHYKSVTGEAALRGVDYEILSSLTNPDLAQVRYRVMLKSILVVMSSGTSS